MQLMSSQLTIILTNERFPLWNWGFSAFFQTVLSSINYKMNDILHNNQQGLENCAFKIFTYLKERNV